VKNIQFRTDPDDPKIILIAVDTSKAYGKSRSGKTTIVASTEGNIPVATAYGDITFGVNVYKYQDTE